MNIYLVEKMGLEVTEYPYMKPAEMNYHEYIDIKKLIVKPGYLRLETRMDNLFPNYHNYIELELQEKKEFQHKDGHCVILFDFYGDVGLSFCSVPLGKDIQSQSNMIRAYDLLKQNVGTVIQKDFV